MTDITEDSFIQFLKELRLNKYNEQINLAQLYEEMKIKYLPKEMNMRCNAELYLIKYILKYQNYKHIYIYKDIPLKLMKKLGMDTLYNNQNIKWNASIGTKPDLICYKNNKWYGVYTSIITYLTMHWIPDYCNIYIRNSRLNQIICFLPKSDKGILNQKLEKKIRCKYGTIFCKDINVNNVIDFILHQKLSLLDVCILYVNKHKVIFEKYFTTHLNKDVRKLLKIE